MFERFTERARLAVVFAQVEARALGHGSIGTEHLLLGLLREDEGLGARVLASLGVSVEAARDEVVAGAGRGEEVPSGQMPFTPRAKHALEGALRQALSLGRHSIGTEHILLGLAVDEESAAARVLASLGLTVEQVRSGVVGVLGGEVRMPALAPIRLTPSIRRLLEIAHEEARALDHNRTHSEHVLLALLRQERSVAARALASFGVTFEDVRAEVVRLREIARRPPGAKDDE
jgi:ATP-dependent Clp protease ATP-binding subunit ClpA